MFLSVSLVVCSVLHSLLAGESTHNQIKACRALKRKGHNILAIFLPPGQNIRILACVRRGVILQGCDRAEARGAFLWPDSFVKASEQNGLACRTGPRSESIEMEQSLWSVSRRSSVTSCLLHPSALKHHLNLWKKCGCSCRYDFISYWDKEPWIQQHVDNRKRLQRKSGVC